MDPASEKVNDRPRRLLDWTSRMLRHCASRPYSKMHHWLAEWLDAAIDLPIEAPPMAPADDDSPSLDAPLARGWRLNILGPRGSAKSTIVTLAYVLREALEGREPYIWIISESKHQAQGHLENIKLELTDNDELQDAYPDAYSKGPIWTVARARLRNGALIEAYGAGQPIRGRRNRQHRPTLIVCDDLQGEPHGASATLRERTRTWFRGTLLKAGTKSTNIINLATALHREALAIELSRTPGWRARTFRAIEEWPINMTLWAEWEQLLCRPDDPRALQQAQRFFEQHRQELLEGAILLWPEEEDLLTLMRQRAESGRAAFEREKQNNPVGAESCEFPDDYFPAEIWFDEWPKLLARVITLDPSKGTDARHSDYSAFVIMGVDEAKFIYVQADLARRTTPQIIEHGVELYRRFRPDVFAVEANQYQSLLADDFQAAFDRLGMVHVAVLPLVNQHPKLLRIRKLGQPLSLRRMRFKANCPGTRMLVDQLRDFPAGQHDDGPDAAEMALRLLDELLVDHAEIDGLGSRLRWE